MCGTYRASHSWHGRAPRQVVSESLSPHRSGGKSVSLNLNEDQLIRTHAGRPSLSVVSRSWDPPFFLPRLLSFVWLTFRCFDVKIVSEPLGFGLVGGRRFAPAQERQHAVVVVGPETKP